MATDSATIGIFIPAKMEMHRRQAISLRREGIRVQRDEMHHEQAIPHRRECNHV